MHEIVLPASRLTRIRNSYRNPAQAALVARIPVIGRRVPLRAFWRSRPVDLARSAAPYMTAVVDATSVAAAAGRGGIVRTAARLDDARQRPEVQRAVGAIAERVPDVRETRHRVADAARHRAAHARELSTADLPLPGRRWPLALFAVAAGAFAMYWLDPAQGRRRRALMRDRFVHAGHVVTRDVPHRVERRGRMVRGMATGARHSAAHLVRGSSDIVVDDETLVARVRSEVLGGDRYHAGEINVDAYQGCVTLRGQLDTPAEIARLIGSAKGVAGVSRIRSYLHLPDELAPNKAEVYELEHMPSL